MEIIIQNIVAFIATVGMGYIVLGQYYEQVEKHNRRIKRRKEFYDIK